MGAYNGLKSTCLKWEFCHQPLKDTCDCVIQKLEIKISKKEKYMY